MSWSAVAAVALGVLYLAKRWDEGVWRARANHAESRYQRDIGVPLWLRDHRPGDGSHNAWLLEFNEEMAKWRLEHRKLLGTPHASSESA